VVDKIYGIDCSNKYESTIPGYLLDFTMKKLGIEINYLSRNNQKGKDKKN
jgi:hypothetical protein